MISNIFKRYLSIRNAVPEDCEFITNMVGQLLRVIFETKKLPEVIGFKESYDAMMKDPEHYPIFIAEEKDEKNPNKVVKLGTAITSTQIMLLVGGPYLYLQDLIVDESARGKGVGSALVKHVIQYSKDHDYRLIELVQPKDTNIYHEQRTKFYTQHGFDLLGRHRLMQLKDIIKIVD